MEAKEDQKLTPEFIIEWFENRPEKASVRDVLDGLREMVELKHRWHVSYPGDRVWEHPYITDSNDGKHVLSKHFFTLYRYDFEDDTRFTFKFGRIGNTTTYTFDV